MNNLSYVNKLLNSSPMIRLTKYVSSRSHTPSEIMHAVTAFSGQRSTLFCVA